MLFMLFLVTSGIALAIGFVLGRIWEIRLGIERQTAVTRHTYRARLVIVTLHWPTA